jgi:hypothetical protein
LRIDPEWLSELVAVAAAGEIIPQPDSNFAHSIYYSSTRSLN